MLNFTAVPSAQVSTAPLSAAKALVETHESSTVLRIGFTDGSQLNIHFEDDSIMQVYDAVVEASVEVPHSPLAQQWLDRLVNSLH